ncbi:MAG: rod shape-determining protein RodA [Proteobacteria bacterium]|nr:rod shape-determining protein RodA [Pseudomonadota bacterium]
MLIVLIFATAGIGLAMLYSVANGNVNPWMSRQLVRFAIGLAVMFTVAFIDIRVWMRLAYPIYGVALSLLVLVQAMGTIGMGAQRWVSLGVFNLQPSELMKIALVLALARYFHSLSHEDVGRVRWLLVPTAMVLAPAALVLMEPDLGTASLLVLGGFALFFLAGVRWWKFAIAVAALLGTIPFAWDRLHSYQKARILTFLDPGRDPLGAGYHILQSKIALGSGGIWGKGYLLGTQSHLSFLPEKQTDFIFTTLAEEFGLVGGLFLLALYVAMMAYGFAIGLRVRSQFGRLLAMGVTTTFFLYVFINVAMVMGLIPVVGVPLPLISYGGTAMVTILTGFGLLLSAYIHRDIQIPKRGGFDPL